MIDFRDLIKAGVHFGHQKTRWCPKMAPYIWGYRNNIHLIDVSKTASHMERAAQFLKELAANNKQILWIGTKKAAQDAINEVAGKLNQPFVSHRWIGGTLSNNSQVKKSVTKLLHFEDIIAKSDKFPHYTKKEFSTFQKMVDRLQKNVGGIRNLVWPVSAVVLVDVNKEQSALKEAVRMGIPVVALVDTNGDPSLIDYVIPANDDAPRSIKLVIDYLADAVAQGQAKALAEAEEKKQARKAEAAAKAKAAVKDESSAAPKEEAKAEAKEGATKIEKTPKKVVKKEAEEEAKPVTAEKKTPKISKPSAKQ